MPWYKTGTVSCTQNSTTVVGSDTAFAVNTRVGDAFRGPDGNWYEVANIGSDTVLSILPAYQGASVTKGLFALAPMQGYVKESADQLRAVVNRFGQLASSTTVGALSGVVGGVNKLPYFTAADSMAVADFTPQARALLDDADASAMLTTLGVSGFAKALLDDIDVATAQATLGLSGAYRRANVLGIVSQNGGAPTGALMERGSNANGEYVRYADGTQECWRGHSQQTAVSPSIPSGGYADIAVTFPAPFVGNPNVLGLGIPMGSWDHYGYMGLTIISSTGATLRFRNGANAQGFTAVYRAIGRWF